MSADGAIAGGGRRGGASVRTVIDEERDSDLADRDYQRLAAFRHALRHFLRFSEEAARSEGLTPNQHQLLLAVRGWPGATTPTISQLADQLQLRVHSTSELVQRAASAELIRLVTDPEDHRRLHVELTDGGHSKLRSLSVLHREELRRFRAHLADLLDVLDEPASP